MIEFSEWIAEIGLRASRAGGVSLALRGAGFDFRWLTDAVRHGIAALRPAAVTVIFALIAVLGLASDSATFALEASRAAIADGQWWRLATGHVTHWSANHLFWDLLMFVALGATLECRNRRRFVALLAASAATISLAVFFLEPQIASYRGLSGIDSALFIAVCLGMLDDARQSGQRPRQTVAIGLVVAFAAKLVYECVTGSTLFVDSYASGFTPLPLAHLVGGIVAVVLHFRPRCVAVC